MGNSSSPRKYARLTLIARKTIKIGCNTLRGVNERHVLNRVEHHSPASVCMYKSSLNTSEKTARSHEYTNLEVFLFDSDPDIPFDLLLVSGHQMIHQRRTWKNRQT